MKKGGEYMGSGGPFDVISNTEPPVELEEEFTDEEIKKRFPITEQKKAISNTEPPALNKNYKPKPFDKGLDKALETGNPFHGMEGDDEEIELQPDDLLNEDGDDLKKAA